MRYEQAKNLSDAEFKRLFGVRRQTFDQMVKAFNENIKLKKNSGVAKLSREDQVLVALQYWREYRTYFHIASDWGVSESTICRTVQKVENILIRCGMFSLPGKKSLWQEEAPEAVVVDVTESPIERPKHGQRRFYSGKKKYHTLKSQLVVNLQTGMIICTAYSHGKQHDFRLFKHSKVSFHEQTVVLADRGYQGMAKIHPNCQTPHKKSRGGTLTQEDKSFNRQLAKLRVVSEHINRYLKIFKILRERYRNRRRRFGLRCNLIAGLYNYELQMTG